MISHSHITTHCGGSSIFIRELRLCQAGNSSVTQEEIHQISFTSGGRREVDPVPHRVVHILWSSPVPYCPGKTHRLTDLWEGPGPGLLAARVCIGLVLFHWAVHGFHGLLIYVHGTCVRIHFKKLKKEHKRMKL